MARVALTGRARRQARICLVLLALMMCAVGPASAQREEPTSPRLGPPLTILQINDVYTSVPVDGLGGLARIATIKQRMLAEGHTPLLVIAGDFLSPSVPSSIFKGEQMIAGFNAMGLDMATLGNHELDFGTDVLLQRMSEAKFQWVISNVIDTRTNRPVGNAAPYVIRQFGAIKVGFVGLCLTTDEISEDRMQNLKLLDPIETAAQLIPTLKREGAEVIVAITHLAFEQDRELAQKFPDIDVIVGGHEHYPITAIDNRTFISKAGSDGRFVARIDVNKRPDNLVERFFELIPVTAAFPDDPATAAVVASYENKLGKELDVVVGTSGSDLDADAVRIRSRETNVGNMVADAFRREVGADVAIVNSGSIRGDKVYPAGPLTLRTLIAMHPFNGVVCKVQVSGSVLREILENGVSRLPNADGRFPQISGFTMKVNLSRPVGSRVSDVKIDGRDLDPEKSYTVAVTDYQFNGGDAYSMLPGPHVLIEPEAGPMIVSTLQKFVAAAGTVKPEVEGRTTIVP